MMKKNQICVLTALAVQAAIAGSTHADVIASTDFDGRTATGETASDLNWSTNGVEDPGNMSALSQIGPGTVNLFDGTTLTQNNFTPGINTGNGDTFWTTDVALTVASGFAVSVTDVTFTYISVNSGEAQNVPRESDFVVTLIDPNGNELESDITFGTSGTTSTPQTPTLTALFDAPIPLDEAGTYTLRINGGDLFITNAGPIGTEDETGNHTGIDDLSINGTVIPEPTSLALLGLGGLALARRRR